MSNSAIDLFGADIAVGSDFQASVAADGTLVLVEGCDCGVQMVAIRLYVFLGTLFYDVTFGSRVLLWIREESTQTTRAGLCAEIESRVNIDPHVVPGSGTASVLAWDTAGVTVDLQFTLIDQTHPEHLVLRLGESGAGALTTEIISHAHPREDSRP